MEVLSRKTYVETGKSFPEAVHDCKAAFQNTKGNKKTTTEPYFERLTIRSKMVGILQHRWETGIPEA